MSKRKASECQERPERSPSLLPPAAPRRSAYAANRRLWQPADNVSNASHASPNLDVKQSDPIASVSDPSGTAVGSYEQRSTSWTGVHPPKNGGEQDSSAAHVDRGSFSRGGADASALDTDASAGEIDASGERSDTSPGEAGNSAETSNAFSVPERGGGTGSLSPRTKMASPETMERLRPPRSATVLRDNHAGLHLRLGPNVSVAILGQYDLVVRKGAILLLGAMLARGTASYRVFAPASHAVPRICSLQPDLAIPSEVEIEIRPCKSGLRRLKFLSPLFHRLWIGSNQLTDVDVGESSRSFAMMEEEALSKVADPLVISVEHHTLYNQIMRAARTRAPRLLVCGPQGSGKSTYARILVNGLLTTVDTRLLQHHVPQVAFLDLDPGQPEFTPPGQVSLLVIQRPVFGPPFSHPFSPDADPQEGFYLISSHATATLTPGADPIQFEACVKSLMLSYLTTLGEEVPLVINYPGWLSAQGVELLLRLTKVICPSTVIYLGELSPTKAVDALRGLSDQITLHVLPSHTGRRHLRTPAQLRAMQTCSYFHLIQSRAGLLQWDATPLTRVPSWVIGYDAGPRAISLSVSGGIRLSLPNVLRVISGSVVAVVVVYKPDIFTSENVTAPDPAQSSCLGQALVRSIDSFTKTMQLVTPIPRALLDGMFDQGYHLVLVCGRGDIPHWAYDEELNVANSRSAKASSSLGAQRTQSMTGTAAAVTQ